jgi:hypothetical protein
MVRSSVSNTWKSGRYWDTFRYKADHDRIGRAQALLWAATTFASYLSDHSSKCRRCDQSGQAVGSSVNSTVSEGPAGFQTGANREARLMANVEAEFPSIYAGIKRRFEGGAGVRESFKVEVSSHIGVETTDDGVTAMIKRIAAICASLKANRRSDFSNRLISFRVVKHKSRSKQARTTKGVIGEGGMRLFRQATKWTLGRENVR